MPQFTIADLSPGRSAKPRCAEPSGVHQWSRGLAHGEDRSEICLVRFEAAFDAIPVIVPSAYSQANSGMMCKLQTKVGEHANNKN